MDEPSIGDFPRRSNQDDYDIEESWSSESQATQVSVQSTELGHSVRLNGGTFVGTSNTYRSPRLEPPSLGPQGPSEFPLIDPPLLPVDPTSTLPPSPTVHLTTLTMHHPCTSCTAA